MSWRIDDIDLEVLPVDSRLLGGDGDLALALLVTTVHDQLLAHLGLVVTEGIGLFQQPINKRRLTVVLALNHLNC